MGCLGLCMPYPISVCCPVVSPESNYTITGVCRVCLMGACQDRISSLRCIRGGCIIIKGGSCVPCKFRQIFYYYYFCWGLREVIVRVSGGNWSFGVGE